MSRTVWRRKSAAVGGKFGLPTRVYTRGTEGVWRCRRDTGEKVFSLRLASRGVLSPSVFLPLRKQRGGSLTSWPPSQ